MAALLSVIQFLHKTEDMRHGFGIQPFGFFHELPQGFRVRICFVEKFLRCYTEIFADIKEYQPSVYSHRNRYMVEHSDRVIAVYDGREKGGTVRTIRFAHQMRKELREIPVGDIFLPH